MEKFDFEDEPVKRQRPRINFLDCFSVLALVITVVVGVFYAYVFVNPTTPLNPLFPKLPTPFLFPSATITPIQLEPTWTPTFVQLTDTPTLAPTITLQPSPTIISLVPPTRTPSPSPTPRAPYGVTITAIPSTIIHPDAGCSFFGIGGSVVDANNTPVLYMTLRLSGTLGGDVVNKLTVSGTALDYGQSGFEFQLGTAPLASSKLLTLQLLDQSGVAQADNVYIITYNDCKRNLILVRFKKN
jgi:hypothetical protein